MLNANPALSSQNSQLLIIKLSGHSHSVALVFVRNNMVVEPKMKNDESRKFSFVCVWLVIVMLVVFFCQIGSADVWRDDFNGDVLKKSWTPMGHFFDWDVEDGRLAVTDRRGPHPEFHKEIGAYSYLQLTGFPGPYQQLTLVLTNVNDHHGIFKVALGMEVLLHYKPRFYSYNFGIRRISDCSSYMKGGQGVGCNHFLFWDGKNPDISWDEPTRLKEMKITFEVGHFEMFVDGELRAEFEDENFDQIDVIGFYMMSPPEPGDRGSGWVDSFTILAPFLSVKLEGKLSTIWGQIKDNFVR